MRRLSTFAVFLLTLSVPAVHAGTVTLITGDQVTVEEGTPSKVNIQPRKGREHIRFVTQHETVGGKQHLQVIPEDAGTLIASGQLDIQLFDITELLESQFDDGSRATLPIIITFQAQTGSLSRSGIAIAGAAKTHDLHVINGVAAEARKADVSALWDSLAPASGVQARAASSNAIQKIWLDRLLKPVLDQSVPQIGAPAAWEQGYDGSGVRVAVVDGGVDTSHPDLAGKVVAARDFTNTANIDTAGHGTHVASIIAGSGAASAGRYRGVAPGVDLISAKVCTSGCPISAILAGIQWAVTEEGAKIVNMSLGGNNTPEIDPVEQAVNTLTEDYGALFVIAAGNSGGFMTVSSPSTADAALSVASVDRSDVIAPTSSRGPRVEDKGIKPEISAPGVGIVAARAAGTALGTPVNESYTTVSGTSMAAPHVAGAAAILAQLHPDYTPAQLKAVLMGSARPSVGAVFAHGAGRVDIPAAIAATVSADPVSLNFGTARWPHDDDQVLTQTITYRNTGSTPQTLNLSVDAETVDGVGAPAGLFSVSSTTVTIPAGDTSTVTLIVDTRVAGPEAIYTGRLLATGSGTRIATPFTVEREPESYDLTVSHINTLGFPTSTYLLTLVPFDARPITLPRVLFGPPQVTLRLPAGRYGINSAQLGQSTALMVKPVQELRSNMSLTFDAREAPVVELTPPTATAQMLFTHLGTEYPAVWGRVRLELTAGGTQIQLATVGDPLPGLLSFVHTQWQDAPPAGETGESASVYAGAWVTKEQLASGPLAFNLEKLAVVRSKYVSAFPAINQGSVASAVNVEDAGLITFILQPVPLPTRRTEYFYSTGGDVRWHSTLMLPPLPSSRFTTGSNRYRPKQMYFSRWNEPPFAPAYPENAELATRRANVITVATPLFSDRASHAGMVGTNARTTVYRNGEKLGEGAGFGAAFTAPPELSTYRVETTAAQSIFGLSTQVSGAWTFQSEQPDTTDAVDLPLLFVKFEPRLNDLGQAPRGRHYELPVSVRRIGAKDLVAVSSLSLEVSYDDGTSWQRAPLRKQGKEWVALLKHPKDAEYVSLRTAARDLSTNAVEATVIRAYALTDASQDTP